MLHLKSYKKYFENNHNDLILYHGSPNDINDIKQIPPTSGESKYLGDGIYVSNDINVSKKYSDKNGFLYQVVLNTPLKSLPYKNDISNTDVINIIKTLNESDIYEHNYISENLQDIIDDNETISGKSFIEMLEREKLNVNDILILVGYNSISCKINIINSFIDFPDLSLNINIIDNNIIDKIIKL